MWKRRGRSGFETDKPERLPAVRAAMLSSRPPDDARRRLAIVSADDELCGIGAYCHALERQLRKLCKSHRPAVRI
jgi:hypothetical protein